MNINVINVVDVLYVLLANTLIVALGNLDQYGWSCSDCLGERWFLVALTGKTLCAPKTHDIKQEFCQSTPTLRENYDGTSPPGCLCIEVNTSLKLNKPFTA